MSEPRRIAKKDAIDRVNRAYEEMRVEAPGVHSANLRAKADLWCIDVSLREIEGLTDDHLNLLLYDGRTDELHHLRVPGSEIREALSAGRLAVREDKNVVSLELSASRENFLRDRRGGKRGLDFSVFRVRL